LSSDFQILGPCDTLPVPSVWNYTLTPIQKYHRAFLQLVLSPRTGSGGSSGAFVCVSHWHARQVLLSPHLTLPASFKTQPTCGCLGALALGSEVGNVPPGDTPGRPCTRTANHQTKIKKKTCLPAAYRQEIVPSCGSAVVLSLVL